MCGRVGVEGRVKEERSAECGGFLVSFFSNVPFRGVHRRSFSRALAEMFGRVELGSGLTESLSSSPGGEDMQVRGWDRCAVVMKSGGSSDSGRVGC